VGRFFAGLLVGGLSLLSRPSLRALGRGAGRLIYALGIRRKVTLDNLAHAFPALPEAERRRIAREAYANMAWGVLESLTSAHLSREKLDALLTVENWEVMERSRAEGKGVLMATGHFGSWELFGHCLASRVPLSAVVKPLKGALNQRIVLSRLESGLKLIPARGALSGTIRALKSGDVVAVLIDQVIDAEHGVFVPFFGRPASTTPGLSLVAARTGAPVVLGMAVRDGLGLRLHFEGPFPFTHTGDSEEDIRRHTAEVTAALERWIRRYPEQWLWLHRRWKVKPP
jgi:KDO2-lipid IV(A) lauroyltransferase